MSLPFTDQQCFFIVMLAFIVVGFQRGWRRELISLVFIMLAVFLVHPDTGRSVALFLARLPNTIAYLMTGKAQPNTAVPDTAGSFLGPLGPILGFALFMALGYYIGNKAFPAKPATPQERFLGIVPAVVSGAFVLIYLSNYVPKSAAGQSLVTVPVFLPNPGDYVPTIFVIALIAVVIALVAARAKKVTSKK